MENITHHFERKYTPFKALLLYEGSEGTEEHATDNGFYVESYDIGRDGRPINAHPLSSAEMKDIALLFKGSAEMYNGFLKSHGIMPPNVLSIDPKHTGTIVWYTPPMSADLFFVDRLGIPCGKASVPALVWKATRSSLSVFALKGKRKPDTRTPLYHAPFFNIGGGGAVCMGTVDIQIDGQTFLEDFIALWQQYFFGSYFSHMLEGGGLTSQNIVQLWQGLVGSPKAFPEDVLMRTDLTIQSLIR